MATQNDFTFTEGQQPLDLHFSMEMAILIGKLG